MFPNRVVSIRGRVIFTSTDEGSAGERCSYSGTDPLSSRPHGGAPCGFRQGTRNHRQFPMGSNISGRTPHARQAAPCPVRGRRQEMQGIPMVLQWPLRDPGGSEGFHLMTRMSADSSGNASPRHVIWCNDETGEVYSRGPLIWNKDSGKMSGGDWSTFPDDAGRQALEQAWASVAGNMYGTRVRKGFPPLGVSWCRLGRATQHRRASCTAPKALVFSAIRRFP
eukprot:gene16254-biopygen1626